ncbi:MAG: UDP-N-acetylglucosamine 2-epimerase [Parvibaculum sp.]
MTRSRRIAVVTGSRAEYGLLHRLICEIETSALLELQLIVTGTHLSARHGATVDEIESDGHKISARVDMRLDGDGPAALTKAMGRALIGFADAFAELSPDMVVVLGDRYEILAAAEAAMLARLPIVHIHGGEASEGQIDEAIRHAITKMSHYHFVAAEPYRARVIQMGENPERVFNVGAPGLDAIMDADVMTFEDAMASVAFIARAPLFLVTYHPVTLRKGAAADACVLLEALDGFPDASVIFTGTNADTDGDEISMLIDAYVERHGDRVMQIASFGRRRYLSVLKGADLVIGNSSSGIIEAPAVGTPTVNIGVRQQGRLRAPSVIDCAEDAGAIRAAIKIGLSPDFKMLAAKCETPYGQGGASIKMARLLETLPLENVLMKRFHVMDAALEIAS